MPQVRVIGVCTSIRFGEMRDGRKGLGSINLDAGLGADGGYSPGCSIAFNENFETAIRNAIRAGESCELLISTPVSKKTGAAWLALDMLIAGAPSVSELSAVA